MSKLLQVLLLLSWLGEGQSSPACSLQGCSMDTFSQPGDILLGGVFVVHSGIIFQQPTFRERPKPVACTGFHIRYYRDILGLMFAIDEINNSPDILPNITLGFSVLDSCMSEVRAVAGILSLLSGLGNPFPGYGCRTHSAMVGIVGDNYSFLSIPIAQITGVFQFPQISYGSTFSTLSNKILFPTFFRTVPSIFQQIALADLARKFGWTWVGILVADDDIGYQGGQIIEARIKSNGGCVAFLEKIHVSYSDKQIKRVVDVIKKSSVNVILMHCPDVHIKALLEALFDEGAIGKILLASDYFGLSPGDFSKKTWKVLNGTIGLIPRTGTMPGFEEFLLNLYPTGNSSYPFIRSFWEKAFSCHWTNGDSENSNTDIKTDVTCTGEEELGSKVSQLFEINDLSYTFHAYLAVYAYVHALHSLLGCPTGLNGFFNGTCGNVKDAQHWKVFRYLKKTSFHSKSGEIMKFNAKGDLPASSDVLNMQILNDNFNLVKVGMIDPEAKLGEKISVNISAILWNDHFSQVPISVCSNSCRPGYRKAPLEGRPNCCYDCVPCSEGEMSNYTDADECIICPSNQWSNEERDRCVPKVLEFLSYDEPLGIMLVTTAAMLSTLTLCILVIFIQYKETPIIKATNRELSYILLVSLVFCFLCSLVFIGQPSTFSCLLRQTFFSVVFSICISSVLAKTIMVIIAFKATNLNSPLRKWVGPTIPHSVVAICSVLQISICSFWLIKSPPFPMLNTKSYKITFECNEGQKVFFYMTLGFMGFLAMASFLVAFLARDLPGSFNEAKLITFSMLVFCCVWISFIPAYLSTSGKYTVAVQIFAILASSAGLLSCIFLPKCYIILVKPERNNRDYLSGNKKKRNTIK